MPVLNAIAELTEAMTAWRHDFHQHPELGFQETRTRQKVIDLLTSWGIDVHEGLGKTGVVGIIKGTKPGGRIGLRADMDALPIKEANTFAHASRHEGVMHACGHDGHTTMLLGAAKHLAEHRDFAGEACVIFQPAEEGLGGAQKMIADGLFDRFACDEVYALHNWPRLPEGHIGLAPGPFMASVNLLNVSVHGIGGHGAMPELAANPLPVAGRFLHELYAHPTCLGQDGDRPVVSLCTIHAGSASNVIPEAVKLSGTIRSFTQTQLNRASARLDDLAGQAPKACRIEIDITDGYPATINSPRQTSYAEKIAQSVVGKARVNGNYPAVLASEDFSFMLEKTPGAYILVGQGRTENDPFVHTNTYDFNDEILPIGASLLVRLVTDRPTG
ncbi:MAG: amidohydrolase [Pseudomonadota bacterium]